jgi:hypothetical protein
MLFGQSYWLKEMLHTLNFMLPHNVTTTSNNNNRVSIPQIHALREISYTKHTHELVLQRNFYLNPGSLLKRLKVY